MGDSGGEVLFLYLVLAEEGAVLVLQGQQVGLNRGLLRD